MYDEQPDGFLREGLAAIPTPGPSRDFDARVLAAVGKRGAVSWRMLFKSLRPALAGAAMSLPLMLGWIQFERAAPERIPTVSAGYVDAPATLLDQPGLTPASVQSLTRVVVSKNRPEGALPPRSSIETPGGAGRIL